MGKNKILIVDDEPFNIRVLRTFLAQMDVEIYEASNGKAALDIVSKVCPDVILLDIVMPEMDGIEMCKELKRKKATQKIPIIFITAFDEVENHAKAHEAGGIGFITKPAQKILVEASVRNALRIKHLHDEVEELIELRKNLTHMIVHDINNYLAIILSSAGFLSTEESLSGDAREDLDLIEKTARNIHVMTQSLLDVERLESGSMPISIKKINMTELVEQRMQLHQLQAQEKRIHMNFQKPDMHLIGKGDSELLTRVFDNLIFNAIKFCPEAGNIEIGASGGEKVVFFSITNDGNPVPSIYHKRIFEKFAQVEMREETSRKGVGLGLAFCKLALEAMNGTIGIESPISGKNDGVKFALQLPTADV